MSLGSWGCSLSFFTLDFQYEILNELTTIKLKKIYRQIDTIF